MVKPVDRVSYDTRVTTDDSTTILDPCVNANACTCVNSIFVCPPHGQYTVHEEDNIIFSDSEPCVNSCRCVGAFENGIYFPEEPGRSSDMCN